MDGDESIANLAAYGYSRATRSSGTHISGGVPVDNPGKSTFRFTKETEEYKYLYKLFQSGIVKASDRPSDFKARYELFNKIGKDAFRTKFNTLKHEFGIATKTGKC